MCAECLAPAGVAGDPSWRGRGISDEVPWCPGTLASSNSAPGGGWGRGGGMGGGCPGLDTVPGTWGTRLVPRGVRARPCWVENWI